MISSYMCRWWKCNILWIQNLPYDNSIKLFVRWVAAVTFKDLLRPKVNSLGLIQRIVNMKAIDLILATCLFIQLLLWLFLLFNTWLKRLSSEVSLQRDGKMCWQEIINTQEPRRSLLVPWNPFSKWSFKECFVDETYFSETCKSL